MRPSLVVCSLEAWDDVWRRNQYLIAGLLEGEPSLRVLFVEPPLDPMHDVRRGRRPARGTGVRQIEGYQGRLWALQPTKWLPRAAGPAADELLVRQTLRAIRAGRFVDPLLWINDPGAAPLLRRTSGPAFYDITDDWLLADRTPSELTRLRSAEQVLMNRCREIVVCSPALQQSKGAQRRVRLIPNAVDVAAYRTPAPRPADLPTRRTAVYVGTLHEDRLDVGLCVQTAERIADRGDLVLVGPNALSPANSARLAAVENISVLGPRRREQVPAYLQHADVLVVPHLRTPFTESLDPIKAYEYRAGGRPVVSTPVAGFREGAEVCVASGEQFGARVFELLSGDIASAELDPDVPDWSLRVAQLREIIDPL